MKKKIAVCANGWSLDALAGAVEGLREFAAKKDFDIYVFMSFASYSAHQNLMQGELNIYKLCDPADYDGVIVFSNMLNSDTTAEEICSDAVKKAVPVVSIGKEMEGIPSVFVDNRAGLKTVVEHLIADHGVKKIFYMGGTPEHVDSCERLKVTREVMHEHGLELDDEEVGYGKWSNRRTVDALHEYLDKGRGMPDAIVCANDAMALAVCNELEKLGYDVPGDVKVTGFDNIESGRIFYPAITTVQADFKTVAKKAYDIMSGKLCPDDEQSGISVPAIPVMAESCGCVGNPHYIGLRHMYCKHSFQRSADANLVEQNERVLRERISDVSDYQDMKEKLRHHYRENHQYEGSAFYMVLNDDYFMNTLATDEEICGGGLKGQLDVAVALRDGKLLDVEKVDASRLIPGYRKQKNEQHIFYICPLHYFANNYGYVVFTDEPYVLNEIMMYPYLEKIQQSLRLLRVNLRLKLLFDKDPMTGLYNRFGYENKALPLYKESLDKRTRLAVLFVDINSMKSINDNFGHEQGDVAIKTVAAAVSDCLKKDWVAVRYGGDEFIVIVPDCGRQKAASIKRRITERLEKRREDSRLPYSLSASIGYVTTEPDKRPDASLKDYIREADALMYSIKKEMHGPVRG